MPELPEVETVRRGLNQLTLNQEITSGDVLLARTIAHPPSTEKFLAGMRGAAIVQWYRRGKYLLAKLVPSHLLGANSDSQLLTSWLGIHLRMTGQLLWLHPDEPLQKHARVRLFLTDQWELRFVDQRTFGRMWWVPPGVALESVITGLKELGVEPLSPQFSVEYLVGKLGNRHRPIKTALLDQKIVAGLGNIYADEALFKSGVQPETLCTDLQIAQIERLWSAIINVLQTSIEVGGTTFSHFLSVQGINGNYGGMAWVYGRTGKPCRVCATPIERVRLAGRSTHFCPQCQQEGLGKTGNPKFPLPPSPLYSP